MANYGGPLLMQGPMSQMQDGHGSFVPYYNPCCSACKQNYPCSTAGCCGQPVPNPTPPTYLAQPSAAEAPLPVRTGVTTVRLGHGAPTGCSSCPPAASCSHGVTPVVTQSTVTQTPDGVRVHHGGASTMYTPRTHGLIATYPGATAPVSTLPSGCDEDAILCNLLKGHHHYLNWHAGKPVHRVPNKAMLPQGWENALNGFLPCTFDEHQYDGICDGCRGGGSCKSDKCKYKPGHFLITIEPAQTDREKSYGPFVLAANGIRGRNIWLTRGKRYYFTFQACKLSIDKDTGMPVPPSEGGVVVTQTDTPFIFQPVSIIFTGDMVPQTATQTRYPIVNTEPIPLWGTQWLYVAPQMQTMFDIVAYYDAQPYNPATTNLRAVLPAAGLRVGVGEQPTSSIPFPVA